MAAETKNSAPGSPIAAGGKLAVLAIFALALCMASFAWWWNYSHAQRTLKFYGAEAATLIRTAPKVELLTATGEIDISKAPGLINARTSLLADASYQWHEPAAVAIDPEASVRFSNHGKTAVVGFDFQSQAVQNPSTGKTATLITKTAEGWRSFVARNSKQSDFAPKTPAGH